MTSTADRSINIFVDSAGSFDRVLASQARRMVETALGRLESSADHKPMVREVAAELGLHPRRVVRLLEAFGLRDRVNARAVYGVREAVQ